MTVGLEMGGTEVLAPIVDDARPDPAVAHPSLVDATHEMDRLFGVTNIPQAFWIDEAGTIVRGPDNAVPPMVMRLNEAGELQPYGMGMLVDVDTESYAAMLRDWAEHGADSEHVLSADEVVAASHPRPPEVSEAAAHFELAQHLWRTDGFSERVLGHFGRAHALQPDNITYKRQAYSAWRVGQGADEVWGRFDQSPHDDEDWPFVSDFYKDMEAIGFSFTLK